MDARMPFISEGSLTLTAVALNGAGTAPVSFDSAKFANTYRTPIEIRELSIVVESRASLEVAAPNIVALSMKVGRHFMTDGFVPISVLAPYKMSAGGNSSYSETYPEGTTSTHVYLRRMLFTKPIVLRPGQSFGFQARVPQQMLYPADPLTPTFNIRIAMIGRFLAISDRIPATNAIPMISHVELRQDNRFSDETELRNPLEVDVNIRNLVLSPYYVQVSNGALYEVEDFNGNGTVGVLTPLGLRFPDGSPLNADTDLLPQRELFSPMRLCPIRFTLPRGSRIQATLSANAAEAIGQPLPTAYQVALFGTREEAL